MKLKKSVKRFLIVVVILILGISLCFVYQSFKPKKEVKKAKIVSEIKEYGYALKSNKSKAYKKEFENLVKVLKKDPVDEEEYVKEISTLFLLDFYTLSDKVANTDVGGIDFVHVDATTTFLKVAEDTVYKYVENNMYGSRKQPLPTVRGVTIENIEKTEYTVNDVTDSEAYRVDASLEYEEEMGYQKKVTLIFIHEDKKLSLVEME